MNITNTIKIAKAATGEYPYNILLLADETIEAIHKYIYSSDVYIVKNADEIIGVLCLFHIDEETVEIKNIAVSEKWQGKGIGTRLLGKAEDIAGEDNYTTIIVGTADCGTRQIHFYEKNGYTKYAIKKNFFVENYPEPIYENRMMLKDMIMLKKELKNREPEANILKANISDYPEIMKVWESAVKATHHFLKPKDFEYYKQMGTTKYLPAVDLYVLRIEKTIIGFIGVSGNHLEMLFIDADFRGKGYGKILLNYAIRNLGITTLDVNEQNEQALGFYKKMAFTIAGRSEKDAEGKDYPILHLKLMEDIKIRKIKEAEIGELEELLYKAIYQPDKENFTPRSVLNIPEVYAYIKDFGTMKDDCCFVAEHRGKIIGAVWVRILSGNIKGYGYIDDKTPEFAISLFEKYRNQGIGTNLMNRMIDYLREKGNQHTSLNVKKENYAVKLYKKLGFEVIKENNKDYLMVLKLQESNKSIK